MTKSVRVLIVDDQEPFRSAARLVVELTDGFEVAGEAATGEEGIALVAELAPDLVLMDIKMPGMDGLDATRRIAADTPSTRVVVLSTYAAEEYEHLAIEAGAIAFVSKSDLSPDELLAAWRA
jgi:DNA-binding NarL/FixJ family response regulator